jgi:hypothetical protein
VRNPPCPGTHLGLEGLPVEPVICIARALVTHWGGPALTRKTQRSRNPQYDPRASFAAPCQACIPVPTIPVRMPAFLHVMGKAAARTSEKTLVSNPAAAVMRFGARVTPRYALNETSRHNCGEPRHPPKHRGRKEVKKDLGEAAGPMHPLSPEGYSIKPASLDTGLSPLRDIAVFDPMANSCEQWAMREKVWRHRGTGLGYRPWKLLGSDLLRGWKGGL